MKVQRGYSEAMQNACARVPFGTCLCGLAASEREVVSCGYNDSAHKTQYEDISPHSNYCIPIISKEKVLGVINLLLTEDYKRNKEDDDLMTSIANTTAGVIERKRSEQEKQRLREQLAQFEKLSALGRLTANVAHEIRNPLTSIGGYARRLSKKIPAESPKKGDIEIIIAEVNRLERILKNILTFSRETRLNLKNNNINGVINDSLKTFELICREKSISIKKLLSEVPPIKADSDHIREAVNNIVSNAIDSMPGGGTLTVLTEKEVIKGRAYLKIKITDTGVGIPDDKLKLVFEPFFTTKVLEQGTGLGLAICKKILEDHGGFIRVESAAGKGSAFSLYIPYQSGDNHISEMPLQPDTSTEGKK